MPWERIVQQVGPNARIALYGLPPRSWYHATSMLALLRDASMAPTNVRSIPRATCTDTLLTLFVTAFLQLFHLPLELLDEFHQVLLSLADVV